MICGNKFINSDIDSVKVTALFVCTAVFGLLSLSLHILFTNVQ